MFILEFTQWVMMANIVAWPLADLLMNRWLQNFAYRVRFGFELFVFSGGVLF